MTLWRRVTGPGSPLRAAAARVVDHVVVPVAGGPPPGLRRGRDLPRGDGGPVAVVVLVGEDPDVCDALLRRLRAVQTEPGGETLTPVVVADPALWPRVRQAGYVVEHLPAEPDRRRHQVGELRRTYDTDTVLVVAGPAAVDALDAALLLGAVAPRRPRPGAVRRLMRRLEARFDPHP